MTHRDPYWRDGRPGRHARDHGDAGHTDHGRHGSGYEDMGAHSDFQGGRGSFGGGRGFGPESGDYGAGDRGSFQDARPHGGSARYGGGNPDDEGWHRQGRDEGRAYAGYDDHGWGSQSGPYHDQGHRQWSGGGDAGPGYGPGGADYGGGHGAGRPRGRGFSRGGSYGDAHTHEDMGAYHRPGRGGQQPIDRRWGSTSHDSTGHGGGTDAGGWHSRDRGTARWGAGGEARRGGDWHHDSPAYRGSGTGGPAGNDFRGANWSGDDWRGGYRRGDAGGDAQGAGSYGQGAGPANSAPVGHGAGGVYGGGYDGPRGSGADYGYREGTGLGWRSGKAPKGYRRSDERIREDICEHLMHEHELDASDVSVDVHEGTVTLSGTVQARWMKHRLEDVADGCSGVVDVRNEVRVLRPGENGRQTAAGTTLETSASGASRASSRDEASGAGTASTPGSRETAARATGGMGTGDTATEGEPGTTAGSGTSGAVQIR